MNDHDNDLEYPYWGRQIEELANEILRLASLCKITLGDESIAEKVLKNDDSVCGVHNPVGFRKLREALMAFFEIQEEAIENIGATQMVLMREKIHEHLAERYDLPDRPTDN